MQKIVSISGLTCSSVGSEKRENALVSGELTEAANGEHEMEVLLVWTNFQRERLFSKCRSLQLTADITCEKAAPKPSAALAAPILQMPLRYILFLCMLLFFFSTLNSSQNLPKRSLLTSVSQKNKIGLVVKAIMTRGTMIHCLQSRHYRRNILL